MPGEGAPPSSDVVWIAPDVQIYLPQYVDMSIPTCTTHLPSQVDRLWREVEELRRQVASQEELLGGPGSAAVGRTVGEVDEQLESEEGDRLDHERKRDDLTRRQVGGGGGSPVGWPVRGPDKVPGEGGGRT